MHSASNSELKTVDFALKIVFSIRCHHALSFSLLRHDMATRKDRFFKRYVLSSSVVCEICSIYS